MMDGLAGRKLNLKLKNQLIKLLMCSVVDLGAW